MTTEQQAAIDPKVIARIQKMLNLARNGGATEGEAAAAAEAARKTMAKYNITIAEVEASGAIAGEGSKRTKQATKGRAQYEFQQQLMLVCAEVNFCYPLLQKEWSRGTSRVTGFVLIGREANVVAARELYNYLNATTERLAFEYVGRDNRQRLSRAAVSFKTGCAERLGERLRVRFQDAMEEQAREARERNAAAKHPAATPGTALAVVMTDFAQDEKDRNTDFRMGLAEGTTALRRRESAAESLAFWASKEAVEKSPHTEREALMTVASAAAEPVAALHHLSQERLERAVEMVVNARMEELREETETPAQKAKRKERERKENERWWKRHEREQHEKASRTDWSAKHAGTRAGNKVGLDKQVNDAPGTRRIK